jgi:hypothetical protein
MLVLALALVGGTGCLVSRAVNNAAAEREMHEQDAAYRRRIADLTPSADTGNGPAMMELAQTLMVLREAGSADLARALDVLSRAARDGYAPAQALLGDTLANGWIPLGVFRPLPTGLQDRERGLALLKQSATQSCRYKIGASVNAAHWISPAVSLSRALQRAGRSDDAALWRARSILHCGDIGGFDPAGTAQSPGLAPRMRTDALVAMLLTPGRKDIAETEAAMPTELVAAAEREAADLRRRVAESERAYPAPKQKEFR